MLARLTTADSEEAAWATAGLIVGAVFGVLAASFVLLRLYRWWARRAAATLAEPVAPLAEPGDRFAKWQPALTDLIDAYRDVQRRALALPVVAIGTSWGRWHGKRDVWAWLSTARGEVYPGAIAPRILVDYLLAEHFGSRLRLLRRSVLSDTSLTPEEQDRLLQPIDRVVPIWPRQPVLDLIIRYVLPFGGIVTAVVTGVGRIALRALAQPPTLSLVWLYLALAYLVLFAVVPASAWVTKRGLMLGGRGASACTPILLEGRGTYAIEARVFGPLAPARHEAQLDLLYAGVLGVLVAAIVILVFERFNLQPLVTDLTAFAIAALAVVTAARASIDRRRLGRW